MAGYSCIGLDIGSNLIKLVQLKRVRGRVSLYRCAAAPMPKGTMQGGVISDPEALAGALARLRLAQPWHWNRVILAPAPRHLILRRLSLPPFTSREMGRAIRWEAEKLLPMPLDQAVYDYARIEKRALRETTACDYLVAALPRAVVDSYTAVVSRAGFYPEAIEPAPFALQRSLLFGVAPPEEPGAVLVINLGAAGTDLLIAARGRYRFYRYLNFGTSHLSLAAAPGLAGEAAPKSDEASSNPALTGDSLQKAAAALARQINRSLEYYAYETDYPEVNCRAAFLCGGGAAIPGLEELLGRELGLATRRLNPLGKLQSCRRANLPVAKAEPECTMNVDAEGPLFCLALGLALRGWRI